MIQVVTRLYDIKSIEDIKKLDNFVNFFINDIQKDSKISHILNVDIKPCCNQGGYVTFFFVTVQYLIYDHEMSPSEIKKENDILEKDVEKLLENISNTPVTFITEYDKKMAKSLTNSLPIKEK